MPKTTTPARAKKTTTTSANRPKTSAKTKRPLLTGVLRKKSTTSKTKAAAPARRAKPAPASKAPRRARTAIRHVVDAATAIAVANPAFAQLPVPAGLPEIVKKCLNALDEKKAGDLQVLDVREKSSVTDFFIIATATSEPHLRALRVALEKELAETDTRVLHREASAESGWCVVDAFDVIIHLFLAEKRVAYDIEGLWSKTPSRRRSAFGA